MDQQRSYCSLASHLKFCVANFAALGLIIGVFGYAGRILGLNLPLYTWLTWTMRLPDLLVIFLLLPLALAFVGLLVAFTSYLPVLWMMRALEHGKFRKSAR